MTNELKPLSEIMSSTETEQLTIDVPANWVEQCAEQMGLSHDLAKYRLTQWLMNCIYVDMANSYDRTLKRLLCDLPSDASVLKDLRDMVEYWNKTKDN